MSEAVGLRQRLFGWFGDAAKASADVLPVRIGGTDFSRTPANPARVSDIDLPLVWVTVALLAWGLVMVYSASIAMPDNPRFARYAHSHFLTRHAVSLVIGFVVALLAFQVPLSTWERVAPWLFIASLVLLIAVLFFAFPRQIVGIFSADANVIAIGAEWLRILSYSLFVYGWWMVSVQAFNGAGDTKTPTWINVVFFWLIQIPLAWLLALHLQLGQSGVFWAVFVSETSVGLFTLWLFSRGRWMPVQG